MIPDPRVVIAGLVVGLVAGVSGVGGSALLAPILILVLGVQPVVAVGTDLVYSVPTKLLAAIVHWRQGTVDGKLVGQLTMGGVVGAVAGLIAFGALRAHVDPKTLQHVTRHAIGIAILIACAAILAQRFFRIRKENDQRPGSLGANIAIGLVVGFLVALTSIGSGSITLPLLLLFGPGIVLRRLVGSEIAFAAAIVPIAAFGHARFGDVDWRLTAGLLCGSLPGVYIGSRLAGKLHDLALRWVVVAILAFAGARLL
ncbi:MAG TPA: sulfite exporter TauE/SafE family protein [Candidatus Sulfotelmatobacter sp.]|nr:sulfite exporter TauE/SafE family protein [Candidatus Sulfotelmatobacter sp.]